MIEFVIQLLQYLSIVLRTVCMWTLLNLSFIDTLGFINLLDIFYRHLLDVKSFILRFVLRLHQLISIGYHHLFAFRIMALAENLNRAIVKGDLNLVQKLVAEGAAMDFMLGMRGTALCAALSANQTDIAHFLIEAGCGVNVEDYDKEPPIFLAISKKCFDVVHRLTLHPKCNLNKYDPLTNVSPLALAVKNNHQDVVKWFIEAGADLNVTDHTDSTALHIAIQDRNYDMMDMLVKGGCDLSKNDSTGRYPIHIIASKGDERGLKILLQKWIDVSDKLPTEFSMYSFLSTIDQVNVRQLLNKTTKAGLSTSTPLHFAISNGHSLMSQFLLRYGSSPNGPEDRLAESPLLSAISAASCQTG